MVRKIVEKVPDEQLKEDLEKYRQLAIELGATDAKVITADMIIVDERVRAKCAYPRCRFYGSNSLCPPYAIDLDEIRKIVNKYRYAIFTRIKVPSEELAGANAREKRLLVPPHRKTHEIVSKIESQAFFEGYHLALGFACGPCKIIFCPDIECSALVTGQSCRHSLRARSSMEGAGMDAFTMAAKVGWDIYPIGASISPSEVPCGSTLGLVLIY